MLNALREGARGGVTKFVLLGFMALAVGGLVLTDVGGFFRGGISSNIVAEGKGVEITARAFDESVRRALAPQNLSPQQAYQMGFINAILRNEVQMQLFYRAAEKIGLNVGDEDVKEQIARIAEPLTQGAPDKGAALRSVLRARGISEDQFITSIRQEMAKTALQNAIASGGVVMPERYTKLLYATENQTRDISAFILKDADIKDIEQPTPQQLQAYYEANKGQFAIPETRKLTLAILKSEMVTDTIDITEDELQQAYEENIAAYSKPERRKVQQAVLSTPELAERVAKQVKDGRSLKSSVRNVTGDETAYLGENEFQQSGLLEEVAGPVFGAAKDDILGPIQTALGWHVIKVTGLLEPEIEPLSKVKKELEEALLNERSFETLLETANLIDDRLASGEELEPIVDEFGLTTQTIGPVRVNGMDEKGKNLLESYGNDAGQILELGFDYETGEAAPVIETADGQFVIVRVDEITPLTYTPYEEVQKDIETQYLDEQRSIMNRARAQDIFAAVDGGADFKETADNAGARIQNFSKLKKDQEAPKAIGPLALSQLFTKEKGKAVLAETDGGILIAQVTEIHFADGNKAKADDLEELSQTLRSENSTRFLNAYMESLIDRANIKINDRLLARTYGMGDGL